MAKQTNYVCRSQQPTGTNLSRLIKKPAAKAKIGQNDEPLQTRVGSLEKIICGPIKTKLNQRHHSVSVTCEKAFSSKISIAKSVSIILQSLSSLSKYLHSCSLVSKKPHLSTAFSKWKGNSKECSDMRQTKKAASYFILRKIK